MRRFGVLASALVILSACQDEKRPALSVDQARQVQAQFQGQAAFVPPPRTIADVTAILAAHAPDEARIADLKAAAEGAPAPGAPARDVFEALLARGIANGELGRYGRQVADLRAALKVADDNRLDGNRAAQQLQIAEAVIGNNRNALRFAQERLRATIASGRLGGVSHAWTQVAQQQVWLGDLAGAERSLTEADRVMRDPGLMRWEGYSALLPDWQGAAQRTRAELLVAQGRYDEAERVIREALGNVARTRRNEAEIRRHVPDLPPGTYAFVEIVTIGRLGGILLRQGRTVEAEVEYRRALVASLQLYGRYNPRTAAASLNLARTLMEQGRVAEAGQLAQVALDVFERIGQTSGSRVVALAHLLTGLAGAERHDMTAAAGAVDRALAVFADDADERFRWVEGNPAVIATLIAAGQSARTLAAAARLADQNRLRLGERHYDTAEARALHGAALAKTGARDPALAEFRAALPTLLQASRQVEDEGGSVARDRRLQIVLEAYVDLLSTLSPGAVAGFDPAAEAFRIADAARARGVQRALAASAARASIADPDLAGLVRQEQDAQKQIAAQFGLLSNILAVPADQQDAAATQSLRVNIDRLRGARAALRGEIERRFPDYANLIDPRPSTVAEVQALLRPGEALLSTYVGRERTYVWAIPQAGAPAFAAAPLGEAAVTRAVADLRRALDPNAATLGDIPAYDVARAHSLYASLVEPVRAGLGNATSLLVVPDKALGQVSFALLVTAPTAPVQDAPGAALFSGYARVPFLARQMAITQLPSVAALATLRRVPPGDVARRAFAGFGDPWFSPEQAREAQATQVAALTTRGLQTRGLPLVRRNAPQTQGVSSAELAQLPRLPDTADEVRSIALALRADPGADVFLGARANERQVKTLNLADRRVVMFATHGLVPGDLNGLMQPALALSAPGLSNSDGDGLLTMDEILGLRLNADWVVLSACNTASGDGAGAEAVSGLGRAFFYAGTRALLVTNWPVETTSARALTTDLFARQAANPALPRARALQQAMLGLIDGRGFVDDGKTVFSYAHPIFWAPFSVIGDGGGGRAGS